MDSLRNRRAAVWLAVVVGLLVLSCTDSQSPVGTATQAIGSGQNARTLDFTSRHDALTGVSPSAIVTADFNGDTKLDLATVNLTTNDLTISLGNGDGTFRPPLSSPLPANASPAGLAVGDFDGDHKLDVAVTNQGLDTVSVFLGRGNGAFKPPSTIAFPASSFLSAIAVGDFNGDQKLDIVVTAKGVSVLLGKGDGTFKPPLDFPFPQPAFFVPSLAVGDFDGDRKLDVAAASFDRNEVTVLLGKGNGTFRAGPILAVDSPLAVAAGDLNPGHALDLAVSSFTSVSVFLGQGNGTFAPATTIPIDSASTLLSIVLADLDGDRDLDIAVGDQAGSVFTLLDDGQGSFDTPTRVPGGFNLTSLAAGEFNGDQKTDLAASLTNGSSAGVFLGKGDGTFRVAPAFPAGLIPEAIASGDFDGDGKLDLVTTGFFGDPVSVLLGDGNGRFQAPKSTPVPGFSFSTGVAVGDFDGDGKLDVVAASFATDLVLLLGKGDGTFRDPQFVTLPTGPGLRFLLVDDVNGDRKPDVVAVSTDGASVLVLLGNGNGKFKPAQAYAVPGAPMAVAVGDFDGDHRLDLAVSSSNGALSVLSGKVNGTFAPAVTVFSGVSLSYVIAADFDGDHVLDLALTDRGAGAHGFGALLVLKGKGNGTFEPLQSYTTDGGDILIARDYDGDGVLDIAAQIQSDDAVAIFLGRGNGTFEPLRLFGAGPATTAMSGGDFNGDDRPDLVITTVVDDALSVLLDTTEG